MSFVMHASCKLWLLGSSPTKKMMSSSAVAPTSSSGATGSDITDSSPDNLFSEFRRLCQQLEAEPSYNAKTKIVADFIKHGSSVGRDIYGSKEVQSLYQDTSEVVEVGIYMVARRSNLSIRTPQN